MEPAVEKSGFENY